MADLVVKDRGTLEALLAKARPAMEALLPANLTPERLMKIAVIACAKNPTLYECTQQSVLQCVILGAELGLEAGGPLGHLWLVPFKNKGRLECTQAKEAIDSNEVLYESAKALIMEAIGDGEGIGGDWGRVLFRKAKDSQVINWEQVARDVAMWSHFPVAKFMELMQSHTTTKMGSRRFLFQPRRTKEDA